MWEKYVQNRMKIKKTIYRVSNFMVFMFSDYLLLLASLLNIVLHNCPAFMKMWAVNPVEEVVAVAGFDAELHQLTSCVG